MKDFLKRELSIGDDVVLIAPSYRHLVKAKITAFTPKKVRVSFINNWNFTSREETFLQDANQLIKI